MKNDMKDMIIIFLSILLILETIITIRVCQLYKPNADIVLHDYGQVFESTIDWQIWRLEHERDL